MGVVYEARDTQLNRLVALKALPASAAGDPERRSRLRQGAHAASALTRPNIVTIHDVLRQDDGDYIVMELVVGKTLDRLIPRRGLPLGEALRIAVQIASVLEATHEAGIVHRDLKPANVVVGDDGRARVLDFGLAKLMDAAAVSAEDVTHRRATEAAPQTRDGRIPGTASYMSPEQAEGRPVDVRSALRRVQLRSAHPRDAARAAALPGRLDGVDARRGDQGGPAPAARGRAARPREARRTVPAQGPAPADPAHERGPPRARGPEGGIRFEPARGRNRVLGGREEGLAARDHALDWLVVFVSLTLFGLRTACALEQRGAEYSDIRSRLTRDVARFAAARGERSRSHGDGAGPPRGAL